MITASKKKLGIHFKHLVPMQLTQYIKLITQWIKPFYLSGESILFK